MRAPRLEPRRLTVVVQGFGNVGGVAATELHERGATVVAVSRRLGWRRHDPDGLDVPTLTEYAREHGSLDGFPGASSSNEELLELACDVLVLAAREDQMTEATPASSLPPGRRGRQRADLDRRPTPILAERGIPVLPDVLTNAGGVTVSYFEWVQDLSRLFWDRDEIRQPARREARRRVRPGLGPLGVPAGSRCAAPLSSPASAMSPPRSRRGGSTRERCRTAERQGRDGLRPARARAADATAQEAGEALMRPEVRVGARLRRRRSRRRDHPQDARARGRRARARPALDDARARSPSRRTRRSTRAMPLAEAFAFLEEARLRAGPGGRRAEARRRPLALGRSAAARRGRSPAGPAAEARGSF